MLYTPSHAELGQHPKTRKLARLLGCSIPTAIGHLHLLWHFALKYAPDGDLSRFDSDEIADGCMWEGIPEVLCEALEKCEWIDREDEGAARVHDWQDYGGKALKQKEDNAERQQRWRDRHKTVSKPSPNKRVTVTSPLPNALEEKRVDQKREEETKGERKAAASRGTPAPDVFPVSPEMRDWATTNAPGVDVDYQTARFLDRNRAEGKLYKDWLAAWRNWITSPYAQPTARAPSVRATHTNGTGFSSDDAFSKNLARLRAVGRQP
jgi:hypothetical protein